MTDFIIDGHQDIAWNHFNHGRDFTRSAWDTRRREAGTAVAQVYGPCMVGLPDEILGRIAVVCATIFVPPATSKMFPTDRLVFSTPDEAYRLGIQQMDYYHRLADENERIRLIRTRADLDAVLATWAPGTEFADHRLGLVLLMEGADPILEPAQVEEWYARGLRIIGPAWTATRYSGGTKALGPLTDLGRALLDVMAGFGMILDVSHMAPEACLEALDRYEGPLFAGHANPLHFHKDLIDRNVSDDVIRRIAERDGVVGTMPYNLFLVPGWKLGDRKDAANMNTVIAAIDHVCQITGSARHASIGSDFDGGFGAESTPAGFDTVTDLWAIGDALRARGYDPEDVSAILSGNLLRILRAGLPGG
jgi:membrane dipeptidase